MIPTDFSVAVGGSEASPVPVKITVGPKVFALGALALVAVVAMRKWR